MAVDDEVEQIYVDETHRGSGLASQLLDAAESHIAEAGHRQTWLAVVAGNARARAFYTKRGWTDAGAFVYLAEGDEGSIEIPCHRYVKDL